RRAVSGGLEGQTILWNLTRGIALAKFAVHDGFVTSTRMDSGGIHAISSAFDGTVAYYDLSDAALLRRIKGHGSLVLDIVFSATGDLFLASSGSLFPDAPFADNTVRVWDTATGRQLQILEGHTNSVYSVALSPDEKTALTGSADQSVRLWDLETGAELRRFDGHANWVTEVAITPDGRYGISGSTGNSGGTDPVGGALFVWDLETGEMVRELDTLGVWSMSLSPDGSTLVSGGVWDNQHVFDLQSGVELFQLESAGAGLAFVPDGASVVYAGFGGGLTRVSVSDGTILQRYVYDNPLRTRPSISADGKYLLSSDISGFLNLWDLETGTVLRRYGTFNPGLTMENAISPDGTRALVALDNDILEWDLTIPSLADLRAWIAANRYVRDLTCEERELYQIEPLCAEL
ncbi:MAG: WD40 repeat domain-containing protein, partial [Anaerolineales bacterium]